MRRLKIAPANSKRWHEEIAMKNLGFLVSLAAIAFSTTATAGDIDALMKGCADCHGDNGVSQWDDVPTIAGIDAFSHADALFMFRDEERPCSESEYRQGDTSRAATTMCAIASELDDDVIEAVADAFAQLPFVPAVQEFDPALAATGAAIHEEHCDACHSEGGSNVEDESSILAGQWMGYLDSSIAEYLSGDRPQDKKMKEKLAALSPDEVKALKHFYASQQ